jgi:hypothetical protein
MIKNIVKVVAGILILLGGLTLKATAQINAIADFANADLTSTSQIICLGNDVQLGVPTTTNVTYTWLTRHHSADGSGTGVTINQAGSYTDAATNLTVAGYYTYKLEAKNTVTQCFEVYSYVIYVLPTPTVTTSGPTVLVACENAPAAIQLTASNVSTTGVTEQFAFSYQWYKQMQGGTEEELTGETTQSYTVNTGSVVGLFDYYVKVKYVLKDCGAATSSKTTIEITPKPSKPVITFTSN